jgi:hypothetical protein
MTQTTANPFPDIAPPAGGTTDDSWQHHDPRPYRMLFARVSRGTVLASGLRVLSTVRPALPAPGGGPDPFPHCP